jgi:NAD(P)-dependent dehydrogenase (short-subunit alcohol dehydrogenase family)
MSHDARLDHAFSGKVALVTGGSRGIGKQVARDLAGLGGKVVICSHHSTSLEQARNEFVQAGIPVDAQLCDIRVTAQVNGIVEYVVRQYGRIDILVNNAGYAVYRPFEESSLDEVLDLLDVNLTGAMRCAKASLPSMIAKRSGRIVNISSIGGETIITPNAVYCAAKHGMVAWTRAIRYELARFNIKVNVVCPGYTETNFHADVSFARRNPYRRKKARPLTPTQVSSAIVDAIRTDRVVTFVPSWHRWLVWSLNALPAITIPVWDRIARKRIAQLYERIELEK